MNRRVLVALMLVAVAGISFAGGRREPDPAPPSQTTPEPQPLQESDDPLAIDDETAELLFSMGISPFESRIPSENFFLPVLDGVEQSLDDYQGKVVFLNFWATWCPPCREEMPAMQSLYDELAPEGLEIVAVNVLEPEDTVREFIEETGFTYPVMLDRQGRVSTRYAVRAFPTTYIIDRESNVIAVRAGYHEWATPEMFEGFRVLLEK